MVLRFPVWHLGVVKSWVLKENVAYLGTADI